MNRQTIVVGRFAKTGGLVEALFRWPSCTAIAETSACTCSLNINPQPLRADPWIYDTVNSQVSQFTAWKLNPTGAAPPTFWMPNSAWQLASPGWINPIPFWLPLCGINQYPGSDANEMPLALSPANAPSFEVTVGNDGAVAAVNVAVQPRVSLLNIGGKKLPLPAQTIGSLAPSAQQTLSFALPAAFLANLANTTQRWYGVDVDLAFASDANVTNNQGSSMWMALGQGEGVVTPSFQIVNEFSSAPDSVTLYVAPLVAGVGIVVNGAASNGILGPYPLAPGQSVTPNFGLTVPPNVDGGTFLAPLASAIGVNASGQMIGGLTVVCAVND
jgi:hypothetical protein